MDQIINDNLIILSKIEKDQKLFVDGKKLFVDERYFQSIRRYNDGTTRTDLIYPISWTFNSIFFKTTNFIYGNKHYLIEQAIQGLTILNETYGTEYRELNELRKDIITTWNTMITKRSDFATQTEYSHCYKFTSKIIGCWEYLTKVEDDLGNLNNV